MLDIDYSRIVVQKHNVELMLLDIGVIGQITYQLGVIMLFMIILGSFGL